MFFEYDISLTTLPYGGDAMGRLPDGRAVFVPFGLPGERVRLRLTEEKRGFARGELIEILEPAPERIAPRCKHFAHCGGCHYQNLPYEKQILAKTDILRDQLSRIGKIADPPVQPTVASPNEWNYRNHIQFHLTPQGKIGFVNSTGRIVIPISECHLPEPGINSLWPQLDFEPNTDVKRFALRSAQNQEMMLVLESEESEPPELEIEAELSVVHLHRDHPVVIAGQDHFLIAVLHEDFRVSAGSFFQVNIKIAEKMVEHLVSELSVTSSSVLLDIYCGVGLFSKFFAPKCGRVIGIESSESACEDFVFNLDQFDNVELYEGPAEEIVPHLDLSPEIILLDPPRVGLEKRVVDGILKLDPRTIA